MPTFIKVRAKSQEEFWFNSDKIITIQRSGDPEAETFLIIEGGQYCEVYHVIETVEEIMEMINADIH